MRFRLLFIAIVFAATQAGAQNVMMLSQEICDSITSVYTVDKDVNIAYQFKIQNAVLKSHPRLFRADTTESGERRINKFLYELVQQLTRSCHVYKLESAFLTGETTVFDLEGLFSVGQIDTIQMEAAKLSNNKNFGLLIVSVDDLYPYQNLKEYAIGQGYVWSIGSGLSKGGIVVAFSKKLKRVRISTSSLSKQFLPDEDAQNLIDKVLLPKFTRGQYYEAMIELIDKLEEEL